MGISKAGERAEARFFEITGAKKSADTSAGDAVLVVDGQPAFVEVKGTESGQINQIRPIKFIPLVVWDNREEQGSWHVWEPQAIVRMAIKSSRGHHNEIALESWQTALGKRKGIPDGELKSAVEGAIRSARSSKALELDAVLKELHGRLRDLASEYNNKVSQLLE